MDEVRDMKNYDPQSDFNRKLTDAVKKYGKRPNILICGYTGSGKSSLTRAILGDVVPQDAIGDGAPKTMGFDEYGNELVNIWDSKGLELGETEEQFVEQTRNFIRERQNDPDVDKHIHLVWYAIQGPGARVTDCDKNLIRNIFNTNDVIVVITKSDITRPNQREALKKVLLETGIPGKRIIFTSDIEGGAEGCNELMDLSYEMLPDAYKDAFAEAQQVDKERRIDTVKSKSTAAKSIIATAVAAAAAAGAVPIPCSDAAVLVPIQLSMIASLGALYHLRTEVVKQVALPMLAKTAGIFVATSLTKLIPGLGSAIQASVAGSFTAAMGAYVKNFCEKSAIAKINNEPLPEPTVDWDSFRNIMSSIKANKKA